MAFRQQDGTLERESTPSPPTTPAELTFCQVLQVP